MDRKPATLEGRSGHGVERLRGRFFLPAASSPPVALRAAQARLLELGGVAHAEDVYTRSGSSVVHHLEAGDGAPIVLLHGASGGGANWYRLIEPLSRRYRVIAPDLPGFGESSAITPVAPLGAAVAKWLGEWLDAAELPPVVLVATSFGGLAALRLALVRPERVRALVLVDTVGFGRSLPVPVRLAGTRSLNALARRRSRAATALLFHRYMIASRAELPSAHTRALLDYIVASDAVDTEGRLATALRLFGGMAGQREVLTDDELAALAMPTLLVWGQRDRFLPVRHARRAAHAIPDARLAELPLCGHSPSWERPSDLLSRLHEFLATTA